MFDHKVTLTINNNTNLEMKYCSEWFDSGEKNEDIPNPKRIGSGESVTLEFKDKVGFSGCSGWVKYKMGETIFTFSFSNPSWGRNKVGVGIEEKEAKLSSNNVIWDNMDDHDYNCYFGHFKAKQGSIETVIDWETQSSSGSNNKSHITLTEKSYRLKKLLDGAKYYPVGWIPYLGDWKNAVLKLDIKKIYKYHDPKTINGVGVLTKFFENDLYGLDFQSGEETKLKRYPETDGHYSYVMVPDGDIIYKWNSQLEIDENNYTRHSELHAGKPVICAGEFYLDEKKGDLRKLWLEYNESSGHYKPEAQCLKYVEDKFNMLGIPSSIRLERYSRIKHKKNIGENDNDKSTDL